MARGRKYILVVGDPSAMCSLGKCRSIWKGYIDSCRSKGSIYPELTNDDIAEILHHKEGLLEKSNEQDAPEDHHQETASTIVTESTAKDSGYSSISESGTACSLESDSEDQDEGFSDEEIFQNLKKEWKRDAENVSKLQMDVEDITFEAHGAPVDGNTLEKLTVDSWLFDKHRNAISSYEAEMEVEDGDDDDDDGDIQRYENFEDFFAFDSRWVQREKYYVNYSKEKLEEKLRNYPEKYKLCTLHLEKTHKGYAVPTERSEEIPKINLYGRSNCGMAFDKTEVVVELDNPPVGDKISLNDDYHGKVVGTWNQVKVRKFTKFVCTVDEFNIDLMRPLNKIVPYIHICNPNEGKMGKSIAVYARGRDDRFTIQKRAPVNLRQRDNQVFVVRYLKWGSVFQYPLGIVVKVLPAGTDFQNAMDILKIQYSLTRKFPRPVVKQIQSIIKSLRPGVPEDGQSKSLDLPDDHFASRDDLRDLHCFTIDPNHSKDLDDALSVQFCEDESVSVGVHIADISALVKPGDPIDSEARERSATFYPTRGTDLDEDDCIERPYYMLPDELSTNLCSLIEGKDRLAISIFFNFDKRGKINPRKQEKCPDIRKTVIRSRKKLSYDDTEEILSGFGEEDHVMDSLKILSLAAAHLRHDRLGEAAQFMQHNSAKHPLSHRIIEEFMILSNAKIAEALSNTFKHVPLRVHFPPDKETQEKWQMEYGAVARKTYCLMRFVKDSDKSHHQLPDFITVRRETWQQLLNLTEMKSPKNLFDITRCLALEEDYPMKACARAAWIDIQRQAKFVISNPDDTTADYSHFDLHLPIYGQWTSPIRRYMDIIMQRLLCDMVDGKTQPTEHTYRDLEKMNQICSVYNENYYRFRLFDKDCQVLKACLELQKCGQTSYSPVVTQVEESSFTLKNLDMTSIPRKFTRVRFGTLGLMDAPVPGRHNDVSFKWLKRLFNKKPEILSEGSCIPKNKESFKLNPYHGEVLIPIKVWDDFQNREFWLKGSMQTKLTNIVRYNQDRAARFHNYVSGDMSIQYGDGTDTIILPECKMELHIETGNVLQTLISSSIRMGKLIPCIQLLNITPHFSICVAHRDNPVKMFSDEMAAHPLQEQYQGIEHYKNVLLPVLAIEFAACAVANDDAVTIQNVDIAWEKQDIENKTVYFGAFTLGDNFCEERNIEFSYEGNTEENVYEIVDLGRYYDYICIVYSRKLPLSHGGQNVKSMSTLCNAQSSPFWSGHGLLMKVGKNKRVLFKLLTESLPDAIFKQDESDEGELTCCVELIQKTLPDRRMEDAVYELEKATDLAQSIACGNVDLNSEISKALQKFTKSSKKQKL